MARDTNGLDKLEQQVKDIRAQIVTKENQIIVHDENILVLQTDINTLVNLGKPMYAETIKNKKLSLVKEQTLASNARAAVVSLNGQLEIALDAIDGYNQAVEAYVADGIPYGGSIELADAEAAAIASENAATLAKLEIESDEAKSNAAIKKYILIGVGLLVLVALFFFIKSKMKNKKSK